MNRKLILVFCSLVFSVGIWAQTSGGQIRRPTTNKVASPKQGARNSRAVSPARKRTTTKNIAVDEDLQILEVIPITHATLDGRDVSDEAKGAQLQTVIYTIDDKLFMANYAEKDNTQWGLLEVVERKEQPETATQYGSVKLYCKWNYQSDYEEKPETASVIIEIMKRKNDTNYTITIWADSKLEYQGFVSSKGQTASTTDIEIDDNIQPISIVSLFKYNVVCGTYSLLESARALCSELRSLGYEDVHIYLDEKKYYRVICGRFFYEQKALNFKSRIKATYPNAWILYINNGKEERLFK